jgi:metabolite-proton symporter
MTDDACTLAHEPAAAFAHSPNSTRRILLASLAGTTIEFFDFYIYATAAVLIFPRLFFPPGNGAAATLQSLATFALAFLARPVGSALFGHFGDRIGRKATLVAALSTMGLSTVLIGLLPTYASIGILAPIALATLRLGQGLGLGGEWGGAVLLATENAPAHRRALYGMFPQLGSPLGFLCATGTFLALTAGLTERELYAWGWRLPFLASALLVGIGLYVRLRLTETPAFVRAVEHDERVAVPLLTVLRTYPGTLIAGTLASTTTFALFYLMTVFTLSWGTSELGYTRTAFLLMQMPGVLFFAVAIPVSALLADRLGRRRVLLTATLGIIAFGAVLGPWFASGSAFGVLAALCVGLALMGFTYGPLGTALAELFATPVRYTGVSLTFNLAGILGGSVAPYLAMALATRYGLSFVGYYLASTGLVTFVALLCLRPRVRSGESL